MIPILIPEFPEDDDDIPGIVSLAVRDAVCVAVCVAVCRSLCCSVSQIVLQCALQYDLQCVISEFP